MAMVLGQGNSVGLPPGVNGGSRAKQRTRGPAGDIPKVIGGAVPTLIPYRATSALDGPIPPGSFRTWGCRGNEHGVGTLWREREKQADELDAQ